MRNMMIKVLQNKDMIIYLSSSVSHEGLTHNLQTIIDHLELRSSDIESIDIKIRDGVKLTKSDLDPLP